MDREDTIYIQKIIKLEGGNKYKEGRNKRKWNLDRVC